MKNLKQELNEEIKDALDYIKQRGNNTLKDIMEWDLQGDDGDVFDAGFIAGIEQALRAINRHEALKKPIKIKNGQCTCGSREFTLGEKTFWSASTDSDEPGKIFLSNEEGDGFDDYMNCNSCGVNVELGDEEIEY